jgi:hypothetical protein
MADFTKEGDEGPCQECLSGTLKFSTSKKVEKTEFDVYTCDHCGVFFVVKSIDIFVMDEWYDPALCLEDLLVKLD